MFFKRRPVSLILFFFIPVLLSAQEKHYTDRCKQYRIFYTIPDSLHYDRNFFVEDSLSGNYTQLQVNWIRSAEFKHGFIDVRESDMHALFTIDGKLLAHFCHYIIFYPDD